MLQKNGIQYYDDDVIITSLQKVSIIVISTISYAQYFFSLCAGWIAIDSTGNCYHCWSMYFIICTDKECVEKSG